MAELNQLNLSIQGEHKLLLDTFNKISIVSVWKGCNYRAQVFPQKLVFRFQLPAKTVRLLVSAVVRANEKMGRKPKVMEH